MAVSRSWLPLVMCGALSPTVNAGLLTFEFTAAGHGATVEGTFGYDISRPDGDDDPIVGNYPVGTAFGFEGFLTARVVGGPQDGGEFMRDSSVFWKVFNRVPQDGGDAFLNTGAANFIRLEDRTGNAFSDDALPTTFDLSDYGRSVIYLEYRGLGIPNSTGVAQYAYNLTAISSSVVPRASFNFIAGSGLPVGCGCVSPSAASIATSCWFLVSRVGVQPTDSWFKARHHYQQ